MLSADQFIDVAAVENDEEGDKGDEEEDGAEEFIHCPQPVGPSGKQSYQQTTMPLSNGSTVRYPRRQPSNRQKISQLPSGVTLPPQKSIFIVDFFSGMFYKMFIDLFSYIMVLHSQCQNIHLPVHDVARILGDNIVMVSLPTVCRGFQSPQSPAEPPPFTPPHPQTYCSLATRRGHFAHNIQSLQDASLLKLD